MSSAFGWTRSLPGLTPGVEAGQMYLAPRRFEPVDGTLGCVNILEGHAVEPDIGRGRREKADIVTLDDDDTRSFVGTLDYKSISHWKHLSPNRTKDDGL